LVATFSGAGKTFDEIKANKEVSFSIQSLSRAQIYTIMKFLNDGKEVSNMKGKVQPRGVRTPTLINAVAAAVCGDGRQTIAKLWLVFGFSFDTIHKTLHDNGWLSKKLARWVPKIAKEEEQGRMLEGLVAAVCRHLTPLNNISDLTPADSFQEGLVGGPQLYPLHGV